MAALFFSIALKCYIKTPISPEVIEAQIMQNIESKDAESVAIFAHPRFLVDLKSQPYYWAKHSIRQQQAHCSPDKEQAV